MAVKESWRWVVSALAKPIQNLILLALGLVLAASACVGRIPTGGIVSPTTHSPANERAVILATTTSTQDSGLLDVLVPMFRERTGYNVKPIAVGSGQALALASRGEADAILAHAPDAEMKLVESGDVINRRLVMHNDFVVVGPASDPAGIRGLRTAREALKNIATAKATFISRGDNSGTDQLEKKLWREIGIDPRGQPWYREAGQGMGQVLNLASEKQAYTISDRGTYLAMRNRLQLGVLLEGERSLLNIYHVMQVNPQKHPKVNAEGARAFVEFMVSPEAQEAIGKFGTEKFGQSLFFADAGKDEATLGQD